MEDIWTSQANNSSTTGPNDMKFDKEPQSVDSRQIIDWE